MRLVFAGTPEFAAVILRRLLEIDHEVALVYTQPDRPAGRGRRLEASPVKQVALTHELPVAQPATLRDSQAQSELDAVGADLMIVAAYGLLLPPSVLRMPSHGCINVHASLLPRWRGAAPIVRAIEAGDERTGVCIMQMEATLDTGPVLERMSCAIEPDDTAATLQDRLASLGAGALERALASIDAGTASATPQSQAQICYARRLQKREGRIDWSQPAALIERRVRAFNPWPMVYFECTAPGTTERLRVWACRITHGAARVRPGTVVQVGTEGITVATGDGELVITELQPPGKRAMPARDFLNARPLDAGTVFE